MSQFRPERTRYIIIQTIWIDEKDTGHQDYQMLKVAHDKPDKEIKSETIARVFNQHLAIAVSVTIHNTAIPIGIIPKTNSFTFPMG